MTQEEKARAYDEVLKQIKECTPDENGFITIYPQEIFPELKESEDERIVKELLTFFRESMHGGHILTNKEYDSWIAWLEKQGQKDILEDAILDGNEDGLIAETIRYKHEKQSKQKLDKVEPKFKVGDWIINPRTGLIKHIKNVLLCDNNGNYEFESSSMSIDSVDNSFHLWTIQDAKDGDVLYVNNTVSESIIIYKSFNNGLIKKYASYNKFGFEGEHYLTLNDGYIVPATKEQCDLLFRKMKEAGYEWDAGKKELKKINSYCQENCKGFQETGKCFVDGECKAKREAEQELTDLEEFINELSKQFPDVSFAKLSRIVVRVAKWAKSNQLKQEWSEDDEQHIDSLLKRLDALCRNKFERTRFAISEDIDWLKSLRPQNRWKPSDEQIAQLQSVIDTYGSKGIYDPILTELLFQLKKLKEDKYG